MSTLDQIQLSWFEHGVDSVVTTSGCGCSASWDCVFVSCKSLVD